jgi:hypothetical protein
MAAWKAHDLAGLNPRAYNSGDLQQFAPRLPKPERSENDAWGLLILTLCAAAGVLVGMHDLSSFIAGWTQVMQGMRLLLQ